MKYSACYQPTFLKSFTYPAPTYHQLHKEHGHKEKNDEALAEAEAKGITSPVSRSRRA